MTKHLNDMLTSLFNQQSEGISDDRQQSEKDIDNKANDSHADFNTEIDKVNENV